MSNTSWIRLEEICNITTGKLNANAMVEDGQYPFFTCDKNPFKIDHYAFDCKCVLIGGNNAQGNFPINFYEGKFNAYQRTYVITAKDERSTSIEFLYYYIKIVLASLKENSCGSLTKFLTIGILNDIKIPNFSFEKQNKIATFLSKLDKQIDVNNKIKEELEEMAHTLYNYWFVQFEFPNENGKPYKSSGGEMVWSDELNYEIPAEWEVISLPQVAEFTNGLPMQKHRPKKGDESLPVIKIREMKNGFSSETERCKVDIPDKAIVNNGDVLFSWSASLEVMLWTKGVGGLNQHIYKVTSNKYPKSFFYYALKNYLEHFRMLALSRKTTMGHVTKDHLSDSYVTIPSQNILERFAEITESVLNQIVNIGLENNELMDIRDFILPGLMNGQVTFEGE